MLGDNAITRPPFLPFGVNMPDSESAPSITTLHQTIEQLIAENRKQSDAVHQAEKQRLTAALSTALEEIEASQQALARAAETIRAALEEKGEEISAAPAEEPAPTPADNEPMPPAEEPVPVEVSTTLAEERGPHELDVVAHAASIDNAKQLQTLLRERPEVESAQTREFVNGELRLHLSLKSGLDMSALGDWLAAHSGELVTVTAAVIEIRFAG